jgi:diguanylate cyclase (GGDEF)-like protein
VTVRSELTTSAIRLAAFRIGLVALGASAISYTVNRGTLERDIRAQLLLSTRQTALMESRSFKEIRELEANFLGDFQSQLADPRRHAQLIRDFDLLFMRHADGSYTQRAGIFEGEALSDGRRFPQMSATYAPEVTPTPDIKARFALAFHLSFQYGAATRGRLFNFYGVVPEKGFPIHQASNIARVFSYQGPEALALETYEFYARGFNPAQRGPFLTRMYYDFSNRAWMTTVATPAPEDRTGRRPILACVDVLLDELMARLTVPVLPGATTTMFLPDDKGTLIYHPGHMEDVKVSGGTASIQSLGLAGRYPPLEACRRIEGGGVELFEVQGAIVAATRIPETPAVLTVHYPRRLMRMSILQNLWIVAGLGTLTLLVELLVLRGLLLDRIGRPLARLMEATRRMGRAGHGVDQTDLPLDARGEVGVLAQDFARMVARVEEAHAELEGKVQDRTRELEEANRQLQVLNLTDGLTGIPNRRRWDLTLDEEWRRAVRSGEPLVLAMMDVDSFKAFNDRYGHLAGDGCLRVVALALAGQVHRAGDLVARYGGEEFAAVTPGLRPDQALAFFRSLGGAVEALDLPHAGSAHGRVTMSIGVAWMIPDIRHAPADLIRRADEALYRAKALGRNRVCMDGEES